MSKKLAIKHDNWHILTESINRSIESNETNWNCHLNEWFFSHQTIRKKKTTGKLALFHGNDEFDAPSQHKNRNWFYKSISTPSERMKTKFVQSKWPIYSRHSTYIVIRWNKWFCLFGAHFSFENVKVSSVGLKWVARRTLSTIMGNTNAMEFIFQYHNRWYTRNE